MHAVKGGWVGQTFALARSNESEGRKSRIRLSKKERKAMVESFIKKYQTLNNGSFPSLNLTHKEVGGSFYTVREIVRDIIQENRVLGPAKLSGDGKSTNQLEEYPLGSIAIAPQYHLTQLSNGSQIITDEYHGSNEEPNLVNGHHAVLEDKVFDNGQVINVTIERGLSEPKDVEMQGHRFMELEQNGDDQSNKEADLVSDGNYACPGQEEVDNQHVINGIQVDVGNIESQEQNAALLHSSELSEAENAEESTASRSKVTSIAADVTVETFPLKPATTTAGEFDRSSNELSNVAHSFGKQDLVKVDLATDTGSSQTDGIESLKSFSLMDEKNMTNISNSLDDNKSGLVNVEEMEKHRDPSLESSKYSNKSTGHEMQDLNGNDVKVSSKDVTAVTIEKSQAISGAKAVNVPNGINVKYIDKNVGKSEHLKTEQELNENEVDAQQVGKPQKGSNPTLDRINLESWGGASKNPRKPEGNPIWVVFKVFVDAFVKFWSE
uniref:AT3G52170-like helix-turn-helix domain-containing protein n=1 Tax=Cannabis sativa TaxID=3483 RepID=A0A803QVD0_CANSA